MTRHATPFVTGGELIIVEASLTGPQDTATGRFVLDTGAVYTTITPELADAIGARGPELPGPRVRPRP